MKCGPDERMGGGWDASFEGSAHPIVGAERVEGGLDLLALLSSCTAKLLASEKLVVLVIAVLGLNGFSVINLSNPPKQTTYCQVNFAPRKLDIIEVTSLLIETLRIDKWNIRAVSSE